MMTTFVLFVTLTYYGTRGDSVFVSVEDAVRILNIPAAGFPMAPDFKEAAQVGVVPSGKNLG
jgi:hypothetical protein